MDLEKLLAFDAILGPASWGGPNWGKFDWALARSKLMGELKDEEKRERQRESVEAAQARVNFQGELAREEAERNDFRRSRNIALRMEQTLMDEQLSRSEMDRAAKELEIREAIDAMGPRRIPGLNGLSEGQREGTAGFGRDEILRRIGTMGGVPEVSGAARNMRAAGQNLNWLGQGGYLTDLGQGGYLTDQPMAGTLAEPSFRPFEPRGIAQTSGEDWENWSKRRRAALEARLPWKDTQKGFEATGKQETQEHRMAILITMGQNAQAALRMLPGQQTALMEKRRRLATKMDDPSYSAKTSPENQTADKGLAMTYEAQLADLDERVSNALEILELSQKGLREGAGLPPKKPQLTGAAATPAGQFRAMIESGQPLMLNGAPVTRPQAETIAARAEKIPPDQQAALIAKQLEELELLNLTPKQAVAAVKTGKLPSGRERPRGENIAPEKVIPTWTSLGGIPVPNPFSTAASEFRGGMLPLPLPGFGTAAARERVRKDETPAERKMRIEAEIGAFVGGGGVKASLSLLKVLGAAARHPIQTTKATAQVVRAIGEAKPKENLSALLSYLRSLREGTTAVKGTPGTFPTTPVLPMLPSPASLDDIYRALAALEKTELARLRAQLGP